MKTGKRMGLFQNTVTVWTAPIDKRDTYYA